MSKPDQGCCVDTACDPHTCMNLPDNKTCGDCAHMDRCVSLFGAQKDNRYCDFFPRRFLTKTP